MNTVYTPPNDGPWLCDDDNVLCDGVRGGGIYPTAPTVDGIARRSRPGGSRHRGLTGTLEAPAPAHARNTNLTSGSDR